MTDNLKIAGNPLPDMPWEERPAGCKTTMWRYSANPVIPRNLLPNSNSIFNSAVVPFNGGYAGGRLMWTSYRQFGILAWEELLYGCGVLRNDER